MALLIESALYPKGQTWTILLELLATGSVQRGSLNSPYAHGGDDDLPIALVLELK